MTDVPANTAPPAPPSTPAEAATRLDQLRADPKWTSALLAGGPEHAKVFHELHDLVAKGDGVDQAMSPVLPDGIIQDGKQVEMRGTASMLREMGIRDEITRDVLAGTHAVTRAEYDMTVAWKRDRMADPEWTKRLLAGGAEERRKLTLANIIITGSIKETSS